MKALASTTIKAARGERAAGREKLILVNFQAPGDLVTLTAAVRDLHRAHPGRFLTDVRTSSPELWENNPHITALDDEDPDARVIECHYPLIHESNQRRIHFLHGFLSHLGETLGCDLELTRLAGDIHLSDEELNRPSPIEELTGTDAPYWIIAAGGKFDFTIKWWHFRRWQRVVDELRERVLFVQVGEKHHYHPPLRGVLDLRGRTPLRDLIRLVHHAQGVLCPVTFLMHLAAAVPARSGAPSPRPCVVVAGGREPVEWEAYPGHEFLHTIGQLACCAEGGCWRSRSVPLGDGDEKDEPQHLCVDTVNNLPRCMDLITPAVVVTAVRRSLARVRAASPTAAQWRQLGGFLSPLFEEPVAREWREAKGDRFTPRPAIDLHRTKKPNHQPNQAYA